MVPSAEEHLASALRRAQRVNGNVKLRGEAACAHNRVARQVNKLTLSISAPLGALRAVSLCQRGCTCIKPRRWSSRSAQLSRTSACCATPQWR